MTSRNYCFTSFLPNLPDLIDEEQIHYLIIGKETCPSTGKLHWQGYLESKQPIRIKGAQNLIGDPKAHFERRRGTREQARDYCIKEDKQPFILGDWDWKEQGKRTDLDNLVDDIKLGAKLSDVAINHPKPFIKFHNGITKLWNIHQAQALEEKKIIFHIGDPGTGKTRKVYDNHPIEDIYRKPPGMWWDGYEGQPVVLLDDVDTNSYTITEFLQWFDRYPISVPIKGGFTKLTCKTIYVTSNKAIIELFPGIQAVHIKALERRIHNVVKFPEAIDPTIV